MNACLRTLFALCLAGLMVACTHTATSTLGELPRTPKASIEQQLQQADQAEPEEANLLRLSAADQALKQNDPVRARRILQLIQIDSLKPAQQIFASTLQAELALQRDNPKAALRALEHPSLEFLGELPTSQQVRTHLARANALQGDEQLLAATRERLYVAPLLSEQAQPGNNEAIWAMVTRLPGEQLRATGDADLDGWLELAQIIRSGGIQQQQASLAAWRQNNPQHPAALRLPEALTRLNELASQPFERIALLLPQQGQLSSVARALRDGFLAAHYEAQAAGLDQPSISFYDSSQLRSMDDFYRQAEADGIQLVVGPLEKPLVKQLSDREQLPIVTLALNYSDPGQEAPGQLFQFGLAAEDEAREAARRAWDDGMRSAVALVPRGEWGDRVLDAFRQSWQAQGGTLIAAEHVDQPVKLAQQIGDLFQLRQSEARASRLRSTLGTAVASQPTRRQDVDFIFLAATPQQAQQIKPTLAFQYAGDVPVYATSHLYAGNANQAQMLDLDGIRFCETPWLLGEQSALRQQAGQAWPQANGSLGRLYAMGADAYSLATRLQQLQAVPSTRIDGLSGQLALTPAQRIERRLPWAEFRNGQVVRLPETF